MRIDEYLLAHNTVALQVAARDWQEAVAQGVDLLVHAGAVEPRYCDAILANAAAHGPYFVIVPGFALPHARPEDGVRETGFSLLTLREPVPFGHAEHDPVSVVLCLAATSAAALTEEALAPVMRLLDWEPALERLRQARSAADVQQLFADLPEEE